METGLVRFALGAEGKAYVAISVPHTRRFEEFTSSVASKEQNDAAPLALLTNFLHPRSLDSFIAKEAVRKRFVISSLTAP